MRHYKLVISAAVIALFATVVAACTPVSSQTPLKVGVIHSLTGTMALSEKAVVDAVLLAIEEINTAGGVLGRTIEPLVVDGQSDPAVFAAEAEKLITEEGVAALFGGWTSASRKAMQEVVEANDSLLFYPVQYEGLEQSPNIVYMGATANQQIMPAIQYSIHNLGERFFLVGSDYIFPRAANEIIRDQVAVWGGEIVGEEYLLLGSTEVDAIVQQIVASQPDVILNTINGDSNIAFFQALRETGITPTQIPTISFSVAEQELQSMNIGQMVGDYAAWNYFQSIDSAENQAFITRFQAEYGADRVTSDPIETGYSSVYLWAQAVEKAGTMDINSVKDALSNIQLLAPGGILMVDPNNQHLWKIARIGQINQQGQFDIVWDTNLTVQPIPYPPSRQPEEWVQFLEELYQAWDGQWINPG